MKLFTLDQATRLLPVVDTHVSALQDAARDVVALRRDVAAGRSGSVATRNLLQELSFVVGAAHDAKAELDRLGVEVTDLEHGVVGFPAQVDGELVSLTWRRGQPRITHYRRLSDRPGPEAEVPLARENGNGG